MREKNDRNPVVKVLLGIITLGIYPLYVIHQKRKSQGMADEYAYPDPEVMGEPYITDITDEHCKVCGAPLKANSRFCVMCGAEAERAAGDTDEQEGVLCPRCGKKLRSEAKFCKYCGEKLQQNVNAMPDMENVYAQQDINLVSDSGNTEEKNVKRLCLVCGSEVKQGALFCPRCGAKMNDNAQSQEQGPWDVGAESMAASGEEETEIIGDFDKTVLLPRAAQDKPLSACLVRKSDGERAVISQMLFTVGKDKLQVDYQITGNPAISRKHASIAKEGNRYLLKDLGSSNHTFVNDVEISEQELHSGDRIRFADEEFVFTIE